MDERYELTGGELAYRLRQAEMDVAKKADKDYVDSIANEIRSLRKILIMFMGTVACSATGLSLTLFLTSGIHG